MSFNLHTFVYYIQAIFLKANNNITAIQQFIFPTLLSEKRNVNLFYDLITCAM